MTWNKWWTPDLRRRARGGSIGSGRLGIGPGRLGRVLPGFTGAPFSRRAFLGGGAAVLTLPFLESLGGQRASASSNNPVRLVFVYAPNGMVMDRWTPNGSGAGYDLPEILQPLAPVQDQVCVLTGLANAAAMVPVAGDHARGTGSFLTCATVEHTADAGLIYNGISADQVAAQAIGSATLFPSLEIGTTGGAPVGDCDSGYSCAYTRNISWASETTPMAKLTDPKLVFDRLFAGFDTSLTEDELARRDRWRSSVLDGILDDADALHRKLSTSDQAKLDEYLTGIRDLESRIQGGFTGECLPGEEPGLGLDYVESVAAMNDLVVKALECDLTRIVTFMLENAGSNRAFDFLGIPNAHHEISHHQGLQDNLDALAVIGAWEVQQYASLVEKLSGVVELDGTTLLDNSLVFFSSEISDGDRHNHDDLPVLLAGGGGGYLAPGRHLTFDGDPIANLYLAMLEAAGVAPGTFGLDGTGPLDLS